MFVEISKGSRREMEMLIDRIRKMPVEACFFDPLLAGLRKVLGALEKIVVKIEDLGTKLEALGPAEVPQVQKTVNDFFADLINGKEMNKIRIGVE